MQFASCFGVDGVSISDIQYSLDNFGERYCRRVYSSHELSSARSSRSGLAASLAEKFAVKEAVVKALGMAGRAFSWRDIEVLPGPGVSPLVNLHGEFQRGAPAVSPAVIRVAVTRAGNLVLALAVVQS